MDTGQIIEATRKLVEHLRSFDGDDHKRGLEAAEIIERTLRLFATQPVAARSRLRYDIGGKGMLDWHWSQIHRTELEALSNRLFRLLQAPRDTVG